MGPGNQKWIASNKDSKLLSRIERLIEWRTLKLHYEALVKDSLWNIVGGTEAAPGGDGEPQRKFLARKDQTLAVIVLAVEPSLLGDPEDPQAEAEENNLQLRRKLDRIKTMSELLEILEDRVAHLLASLPDSFDMLVTESVPKWELVTERLLHEESKFKVPRKASSPKSFKCGHFKKDCRKFLVT